MAEASSANRSVELAVDVLIDASPTRVFEAITQDFGAWWGHPFLRPEATSLRFDARVGGYLTEEWDDGAQVVATVTGLNRDRWVHLTGSFHLGIVFGVAEIELIPEGGSTRAALSFRGFGLVNPDVVDAYQSGWRELITVRLKRFVEEGIRLGIDNG